MDALQQTEQQLDWDTEVEYGSDEWIARRSFEIATGYGEAWDERMEQADAIANEFKRMRERSTAA